MELGTQIIYVPDHANGDLNHPDCEPGFVTTHDGPIAHCRYWSKHHPGELRTKANSESTRIENLVVKDTVPQDQVDQAIHQIHEDLMKAYLSYGR